MRRAALSTFLFVAVLGLGCMGVAVPGKASDHCEDTSHPRYDASECDERSAPFLKGLDAYKRYWSALFKWSSCNVSA